MKKEILEELGAISPYLAKMGRIEDGFRMPKGYLDGMTESVMGQLSYIGNTETSNELSTMSPMLARMGKIADGFKVPEHYFEQMTNRVMGQIELETSNEYELSTISPVLARMKKIEDGFKVPAGYFERMTTRVMDQIEFETSQELSTISPMLARMGTVEDGFKIPANYFERMTRGVMQQIELESIPNGVREKTSAWTVVKTRVSSLFAPSGNYARLAFGVFAVVVVSSVVLLRTSGVKDAPSLAAVTADSVETRGAGESPTTDEMQKYIANNVDESDEDNMILEKQLDRPSSSETAKDIKEKNSFHTKTGSGDLEQSLKEELLEEDDLNGKI